jgi:hypothetical protein
VIQKLSHYGEVDSFVCCHRNSVILIQDFGLHRTDFLGRQVTFAESTAGQALKEIMLHDAERAAVYRKSAKWLDDWAER